MRCIGPRCAFGRWFVASSRGLVGMCLQLDSVAFAISGHLFYRAPADSNFWERNQAIAHVADARPD